MLSLVLLTAFISGMFVHDYPEWLKDIFKYYRFQETGSRGRIQRHPKKYEI